jgi:hypothetical protein
MSVESGVEAEWNGVGSRVGSGVSDIAGWDNALQVVVVGTEHMSGGERGVQ